MPDQTRILSPAEPVETVHQQLSGWGAFEGSIAGSCRALIMGELVKLAAPFVEHYHSDFYHDAMWLQANVRGECEFYFSFDECGTYLSENPLLGLNRKHGYACEVTNPDGRGMWFLDMRAVA